MRIRRRSLRSPLFAMRFHQELALFSRTLRDMAMTSVTVETLLAKVTEQLPKGAVVTSMEKYAKALQRAVAVKPPSTSRLAPVMKLPARSEANSRMAPSNSLGSLAEPSKLESALCRSVSPSAPRFDQDDSG